ncbi:class I histocompatibility antigen, F10 alpha chain-like [Mustelus asterias]
MAGGVQGVFLSLALCFYRVQTVASHSLLYQYILSHGLADLPQYSVIGLLDGCETDYYDNTISTIVPRQKWMAEAFNKNYWEHCTITEAGFHGIIKGQFDSWLREENQTASIHYVQGLFGCELNGNKASSGILKFAFDGRYILSFDINTLVWTAHDPVAEELKAKWDKLKDMSLYFKSLLEKDCVNLWWTYYAFGNTSLTRKVIPQVSVTAREGPGWFLHCAVRGFHPQSINVTWLKNGLQVPETKSTGLLPNEDGTYQLTTTLQFDPYDGKQYCCHIEHSSLPGGKTVAWEGKMKKDKHIGLIVAVVVVLLAVIVFIYIKWRRRREYNAV